MIDAKRHAVSFLGMLFFAVMAAGSGGKPSDDKSGSTQTTSANGGDSLIGLGFSVGGAEWTITEVVDRGSRLKNTVLGNELSTQGRYIQVRFKITNKSSKEGFFLARPKLVDDKGREFAHIGYSSDYVTPGGAGESMVDAKIPASMTKDFYEIFEVAADADGLKLKAYDFGFSPKSKNAPLGKIAKAPEPPPAATTTASAAPSATAAKGAPPTKGTKPAVAGASKPKK